MSSVSTGEFLVGGMFFSAQLVGDFSFWFILQLVGILVFSLLTNIVKESKDAGKIKMHILLYNRRTTNKMHTI